VTVLFYPSDEAIPQLKQSSLFYLT